MSKFDGTAIPEKKSKYCLCGLADHAAPEDGGHGRCIDAALQVALDNARAKYCSYAKEHYHYKKSRGRPYHAIEHVNPCNASWRELGLDDLAQVVAEGLAFLGYDPKLSFFEASISLCCNELQLEFRLLGEQFEFSLVRIAAFEFGDDVGDDAGDEPYDAGDNGC